MADKFDVEVIIKLGGCAVTHKRNFETVKPEAIQAAAKLVKQIEGKCVVIHGAGNTCPNVHMDLYTYSTEAPSSCHLVYIASYGTHHELGAPVVGVVVCELRSFGHFQAHEHGTAYGFSEDPSYGRIGFVKTRLSVTKLHHMISEEFITNGIPAVGISPCGSWLTSGGLVTRAAVQPVVELLEAGFVPVLHGDCVLDDVQGCAILSGDKIIEKLVQELRPKRVVFLTDVDGIYDKPPEREDASLLRKVIVDPDGKMSITIATSSLKHDVTGGVREKLQTASNIIRISGAKTRVFVANVMSEVTAYSVCVLGVLEGKGTEVVGETEGNLAVDLQSQSAMTESK